MDKLQQLWQMVDDLDVFVDFGPLLYRNPGLYGLYIADFPPIMGKKSFKPEPAILLDESLVGRPRMQKCILAEELGHHLTAPRTDVRRIYTSFKKFNSNQEIMMAQDERKALTWATDFLMPNKIFCRLMSEGFYIHELAEEFFVTEWMVYRKIELLQGVMIREEKLGSCAP